MRRRFYVYILSNRTGTIYVGVTSNLASRLEQHRLGVGNSFTSQYGITRLVYAEVAERGEDALSRERQIKAWRREKKVALINGVNPHWRDMSSEWAE